VPAGADLDVAGEHPVIGLDVVGLAGVGDNGDLGAAPARLALALEGTVFGPGDISDGRQRSYSCSRAGPDPVDAVQQERGRGATRTDCGRSVSGGPEALLFLLREEPSRAAGKNDAGNGCALIRPVQTQALLKGMALLVQRAVRHQSA